MDTVFLALRVVVSLAVVVGAIWFVQKRVGRGVRGRAKSKPVSVIARQNVGGKASVAVIEFGGKRFLLGVTEHAVSVLDAAEVVAEEVAESVLAEQNFAEALSVAKNGVAKNSVGENSGAAEKGSVIPARDPAIIKPASARLAGSVLSASTWKQALTALRGDR